MINDYDSAIEEIIKMSMLPLSIIIVGVGNNKNFNVMKETLDPLDKGNDFKLQSKISKQHCHRNIIHIFRYNEYCQNPMKLARQLLKKLPKQFIEYMKMNNIKPKESIWNLQMDTKSFMERKIEERNKKVKQKSVSNKLDKFLQQQQDDFIQSLKSLGYADKYIQQIVLSDGIPEPSLNLFIDIYSFIKQIEEEETEANKKIKVPKINPRLDIPKRIIKQVKPLTKFSKVGNRIFKLKEISQLDIMLKAKKKENQDIQKDFIKNIQNSRPDFLVQPNAKEG